MTETYNRDLAYIHDVGFSDYALGAASGLLQILRMHHITQGMVVDLGCGSGIWAKKLMGHGYDVVGVDISTSMVALARRHAPRARFVCASLFDFPLPPSNAVTSLGECLNYMFDREDNQLQSLFSRVHDALKPGGVFIFDIAEPGLVREPPGKRRWDEGRDWAVLLETKEDRETKVLTRHIIAFRKNGRYYRRSEEIHTLRLWPRADVRRRLERAGFRVRIIRSFGNFHLLPGRIGFVARKVTSARHAHGMSHDKKMGGIENPAR